METYPSNILNQIKVVNVNRMLDQVERETAFVKLGWVIKDIMSRRQVQTRVTSRCFTNTETILNVFNS